MSRRKIVVEGTTYHWETNGHGIAIIPPKGTEGGTRRYSASREIGEYDYYDYDSRISVTPRSVAELIYRDILKKPMPERKRTPMPIRYRKPEPVAHWETAADMPRTYLVQAIASLPEAGEVSMPLEVHETFATAREASSRMNNPRTMALVASALKFPDREMLPRRKRDEFHALDRLISWLKTLPLSKEAIPQVKISTCEIPFKVAA